MLRIQPTRQTSAIQKVAYYALLPVGILIYVPLRFLYRGANLIFHLDARGAASNLRELRQEIEEQYGFLFSEHGGRVLDEQSKGHPSFDWASVVIQLDRLYVRASRDRGYTDWYVSPDATSRSWISLGLVLKKIAPTLGSPCSEYQGLRFHLREIEDVLRSEAPLETP
jgi:hypothetical protein